MRIVIISFILCLTVLLRTVVTFLNVDYKVKIDIITLPNPGNEVNIPNSIHIRTRVTHIYSFIIWILGSSIAYSLFIEMKSYMKITVALINVTILSIHGNNLSFTVTVFAVCYEAWMFNYIFVSYAASCAVVIQLIMVMYFIAEITHSIHQVMFLMQYAGNEVCPRNVSSEQFLFHLYNNGFFNFIMFVHLICMTITAVFTEGISMNWSIEKDRIVLLGVAELLYRGYALYCYSRLIVVYKPMSDPGLEVEQDTLKKKTSDDDIERKTLASEEKLTSEIEILQKTATTSFTLQLNESDKLNELQQSLYLKALDLEVIPMTRDLSTDQGNEKTQMNACYLQEEESTQSSEKNKVIEDLQQSILLKALDLAVIPKIKDLLTDEGVEETQTIISVLSELKDELEDPFDDDHDISLSSSSKLVNEKSVDQQNTEHDTFTSQLRERDKQIEELKQNLKEMRQMKLENLASYFSQMEGNLRGVIPAGDTLFLLRGSSQPQFFNWEKYGLSLSAPEGILPSSETCEVVITALAGGEFEFPKGSELVSAVYVISITKPLLKPLTINIQHCVLLETPEQCNSLQFVRAPFNNGIPPYQFEILSGGHFILGNQYGSISCTEFSLFAIYLQLKDNENNGEDSTSDDNDSQQNEATNDNEENDQQLSHSEELETKENNETFGDMDLELQEKETKTKNLEDDEVRRKPLPKSNTIVSTSQNSATKLSEKTVILYYCKVYYEENAILEYKWQIMFTVVKHLNALQQYIKRQYPRAEEAQKIDLVLNLQNDIKFDIQKHHKDIPQGWVIMPRMEPLMLNHTAIKMFGSIGHPEPPLCFVDVYAYKGPQTANVLHYKVPVLGIELDVAVFINLFLRQKPQKFITQDVEMTREMMSHKAHSSASEQQNTVDEFLINQLSAIKMEANSRKRSQGDSEISEEVSKRKREKHDCSDSINSPAIITGDKLEEIKKIIQDVLTQWYPDLSKVLGNSLENIATNMYCHGLISEAVYKTPTFKEIMTEFQSGMNFIRNYQRLVKHCELFLQTLVDQHGPPSQAAFNIAEDWTNNIKRELHITIEFNIIE